MGNLVPKRRHRASRELYSRRIYGVAVAGGHVACDSRPSSRHGCLYSFQTVLPPTIVRTARPFSFQPSNGELRDADSNVSTQTVHSKSGSISVTSAAAPIDNVPALIFNKRLGSTVYISINRMMSILRRLCTSRSRNNLSLLSNPIMPNG